MSKIIVRYLMDTKEVNLVDSITAGTAINVGTEEPTPELLNAHGFGKKSSPYRQNGMSSHSAIMNFMMTKPNEAFQLKALNEHLTSKGWCHGSAASVINDFIDRGWAVKVERGYYRLTMAGTQADVGAVNFFKERMNKLHAHSLKAG
jgi:hypothetical protein